VATRALATKLLLRNALAGSGGPSRSGRVCRIGARHAESANSTRPITTLAAERGWRSRNPEPRNRAACQPLARTRSPVEDRDREQERGKGRGHEKRAPLTLGHNVVDDSIRVRLVAPPGWLGAAVELILVSLLRLLRALTSIRDSLSTATWIEPDRRRTRWLRKCRPPAITPTPRRTTAHRREWTSPEAARSRRSPPPTDRRGCAGPRIDRSCCR
jgi:hypothetical protein